MSALACLAYLSSWGSLACAHHTTCTHLHFKQPASHFVLKMSRPTPFEFGQVLALHRDGCPQRDIACEVIRSDPTAPPLTFGTVGRALRRWKADPTWKGERAEGSGRKREYPYYVAPDL